MISWKQMQPPVILSLHLQMKSSMSMLMINTKNRTIEKQASALVQTRFYQITGHYNSTLNMDLYGLK